MYPALILLQSGPLVVLASIICWISVLLIVRQKLRWCPRRVAAGTLLYIGSYVLLSVNGEYALANHGGQHWTMSWCPAQVIESYRGFARSKIRPTYLAPMYWPLVVVDMWLWHPSLEPWEGYGSG